MGESDLVDDYSHISEDIFYVEENIPGPYDEQDLESLKIHSEYNSQQMLHCKCIEVCNENSCQCLVNKKKSYYKVDGQLLATPDILQKDNLILECNQLCSCSKFKCDNRLVQYGPRKDLKIQKCYILSQSTKDNVKNEHSNVINDESKSSKEQLSVDEQTKGFGLFTETTILKGSFICEYAGEILSKTEAFKRCKFNDENNLMNYIICLNEFTNDQNIQTFVDPSKFGNIGRYMNHDCDPNCTMLPVRVNSTLPKLCLFANKNIEAGCELTFSYGSIFKCNLNLSKRIKCLCQSENCKKLLPNCEFT